MVYVVVESIKLVQIEIAGDSGEHGNELRLMQNAGNFFTI
jgi:hypothetical protein